MDASPDKLMMFHYLDSNPELLTKIVTGDKPQRNTHPYKDDTKQNRKNINLRSPDKKLHEQCQEKNTHRYNDHSQASPVKTFTVTNTQRQQ